MRQQKKDPDLVILIISTDLPFAMERVCGIEKLENIKCLSIMRNKSFCEDYGVLMKSGPLAGLTARAVIVLDEEDKVIYSELVKDLAKEPDYEKALEAYRA